MRRAGLLLALALAGCGEAASSRGSDERTPTVTPASTKEASAVEGRPPDIATSEVEGRYTSLENCPLERFNPEGGGFSVSTCPGVGGYELAIYDSDGRQDLILESPDGRKHPLNLSGVIGAGFSSLGRTAEWRGPARAPAALIIRYDVVENPETPELPVSYLAVAKVGASETCVVGKVRPGIDQNAAARRLADAPGPCLPSPA